MSIVRACTGEVCVRSTRPWSSGSVQNVSCMVRAGWSGPRLSASKLSHSDSIDRALGDLPAHRDEDVGDQLRAGRDRVPGAERGPVGGQRDVDGLLDQHPRLGLGLELGLAGGERLRDGAAGLADPLARLLAPVGRQRADLAVRQRQGRSVAGVLDPDLLQLLEVGGGRDRGERGVARGVNLLGLHGVDLHGVVVGVRSGHGAKSRKRGACRCERVPRLRRCRPGKRARSRRSGRHHRGRRRW